MFHFAAHGRVFLLVHGTDAPSDAAWERYVEALMRADRKDGALKILVFTEGGSPNAGQRARLETTTRKGDLTAVVSGAAFPRFVVSLIALMNRGIRSFAPADVAGALDFLGLSQEERAAVAVELETLARSGSLGSLRVLDAVSAAGALR